MPLVKGKSPAKYQRQKHFFSIIKSLGGYYLNNLKKKSTIGSSDNCLCSSGDFVSGVLAYFWIVLPLFNQTIFRKRKVRSPFLYMILGNTARLP